MIDSSSHINSQIILIRSMLGFVFRLNNQLIKGGKVVYTKIQATNIMIGGDRESIPSQMNEIRGTTKSL